MSDIGTYDPKKQGTFHRRKYFDVEEGVSNVYRVLPPWKTLAKDGRISQYWAIHFGFLGTDKKNRPIPCIQRKGKEGDIKTHCPLCDKISVLRNSLTTLEAAGQTNPSVLETLRAKVKSLSTNKAYHVNAMNPAGEIGVLQLKITSHGALLTRLNELSDIGLDAINLGPNAGFFFDFKRNKDEKGKTVYTVDIATKITKTAGGVTSEYRSAPIDDLILKRMETEAADLTKLYKILGPEELALVATLDPVNIDRVFARPAKVEEATAAEAEDAPETDEEGEDIKAAVALAGNISAAVATAVATPPPYSAPAVSPAIAQPVTPQITTVSPPAPAPVVPTASTSPVSTSPVGTANPSVDDVVNKFLAGVL